MPARSRRCEEKDAAQSASADRRRRRFRRKLSRRTTDGQRPMPAAPQRRRQRVRQPDLLRMPGRNEAQQGWHLRKIRQLRPADGDAKRRMRVRTRLSMDHRAAESLRAEVAVRSDCEAHGGMLPAGHPLEQGHVHVRARQRRPKARHREKVREMLHIAHRRKSDMPLLDQHHQYRNCALHRPGQYPRLRSERPVRVFWPSYSPRAAHARARTVKGVQAQPLLRARLEVHALRLARRAGAEQFRAAWPRSVLRERQCARGSAACIAQGPDPGGTPPRITLPVCPDGRPRNSDGLCPTPTTSCPFPTFPVEGICCTREAIATGTCGRPSRDPCPHDDCSPPVANLCPDGKPKQDGVCPTNRKTCPDGSALGDRELSDPPNRDEEKAQAEA